MGLGPGRLRPGHDADRLAASDHGVGGASLRAAGLTADEPFTHVHGAEKAAALRRQLAGLAGLRAGGRRQP
jgi:hypothetical protein